MQISVVKNWMNCMNTIDYNDAIKLMEKFINTYKVKGKLKGYSYSFSSRKIELRDNSTSESVIICNDRLIYVQSVSRFRTTSFKRYLCEEECFQDSCIGEVDCDEKMELLIKECVDVYYQSVINSLNIGGWVDE